MNTVGSARISARNPHKLSTRVRRLTEDDFNCPQVNKRFEAEARGGKVLQQAQEADEYYRRRWQDALDGRLDRPEEEEYIAPPVQKPLSKAEEEDKAMRFLCNFQSPAEATSHAIRKQQAKKGKELTKNERKQIEKSIQADWAKKDLWLYDQKIKQHAQRVRDDRAAATYTNAAHDHYHYNPTDARASPSHNYNYATNGVLPHSWSQQSFDNYGSTPHTPVSNGTGTLPRTWSQQSAGSNSSQPQQYGAHSSYPFYPQQQQYGQLPAYNQPTYSTPSPYSDPYYNTQQPPYAQPPAHGQYPSHQPAPPPQQYQQQQYTQQQYAYPQPPYTPPPNPFPAY